jgi:hypothetical protein
MKTRSNEATREQLLRVEAGGVAEAQTNPVREAAPGDVARSGSQHHGGQVDPYNLALGRGRRPE